MSGNFIERHTTRAAPQFCDGETRAFEASGRLRETRGFISMTIIRPVADHRELNVEAGGFNSTSR